MNRIIPILLATAFAFALVLGMGGSSCYAPAIEDCQYICAPPGPGMQRCPDDLVCNSEMRCVSGSAMRCNSPNDDAAIDQSMPGDIIPDAPMDGSGSGSGSDGGMVMDATIGG